MGVVAIALGIYFGTQKSGDGGSGGGPKATWSCVDDGQGSGMLLHQGTPCAKYPSVAQCQVVASNPGALACKCPTGQVLLGTTCAPTCLDTATWDSTQNKCVCPTGQTFDNNSKCVPVCSPALAVNSTTGAVTGLFSNNGVCTDSTQVSTRFPQLDVACQKAVCQVPSVCSGSGMYFIGFDPSKHACIPPLGCENKPYLYTWPDGSTTCQGLTYTSVVSSDGKASCVAPDVSTLQEACVTTADGCLAGTHPLRPKEQCTDNSSPTNACRPFDAIPGCPYGSSIDETHCPVAAGNGICHNRTTGTCGPATYICVNKGFTCPPNTSYSTSCASSPLGPCLNNQNQCVGYLPGCRPSTENWAYNNGMCTNQTQNAVGKLSVSVLNESSNVNTLYVVASAPSTYSSPLSSLQYRYVLMPQNTTTVPPPHWAGVVSNATLDTTNSNTVNITIKPDQSLNPVPSGTPLKLVIMGLSQTSDGSRVVSLSSPDLTDGSVATCTLAPDTPLCFPLSFDENKALSVVPQLQSLPQTVQVAPEASQLGLTNAGSVPLDKSKTGTFNGVVLPCSTTNSKAFVILAWNNTSTSSANDVPLYVVSVNGQPKLSTKSNVLVDVVDTAIGAVYEVTLTNPSSTTCKTQPVNTVLDALS